MHYKAVVLDFDGTVFRLFCNYNLDKIKIELMSLLNTYEVEFNLENDAFDVFEKIFNSDLDSQIKKCMLEKVNEIIKGAEIDALNTGVLIDGFSDFLRWMDSKKFSLAIVTNNSEECVREFFSRYYNRMDCVIVGRDCQRPDLMKPNPYMLDKMCELLNLSRNEICFVGDSVRDYNCALAFGCDFIGMAPTSKKKRKLQTRNGNIIIVEDYIELISKGFV